jgi:hypothetical protein
VHLHNPKQPQNVRGGEYGRLFNKKKNIVKTTSDEASDASIVVFGLIVVEMTKLCVVLVDRTL